LDKFLRLVPIRINNFLLRLKKKKFRAAEVLILLPRCMQHASCRQDVVDTIENCKRCGVCPTGAIAACAEARAVAVGLATGSHMARAIIKKHAPRLIIAVACERELAQGIFSVFPRQVFAIVNSRPEGPCKNTRVDLDELNAVIGEFVSE
jgi:uncharacterized protein